RPLRADPQCAGLGPLRLRALPVAAYRRGGPLPAGGTAGPVRFGTAHLACGPRAGAMSPRPAQDPAPRPRDRDPAGRARNAGPRDALGRPLPRGAPGDERIPDDLVLAPAEALNLAQSLLDTGRPFHAHEVLEASWKAAPAAERDLWQGLAQVAGGLTHGRRGHTRRARALLRPGCAP